MRKKVWINQGDIILVSLREYQDERCDVILKYTSDEARILKKSGALPPEGKYSNPQSEVPKARGRPCWVAQKLGRDDASSEY